MLLTRTSCLLCSVQHNVTFLFSFTRFEQVVQDMPNSQLRRCLRSHQLAIDVPHITARLRSDLNQCLKSLIHYYHVLVGTSSDAIHKCLISNASYHMGYEVFHRINMQNIVKSNFPFCLPGASIKWHRIIAWWRDKGVRTRM